MGARFFVAIGQSKGIYYGEELRAVELEFEPPLYGRLSEN